jgi:hypothetical protein
VVQKHLVNLCKISDDRKLFSRTAYYGVYMAMWFLFEVWRAYAYAAFRSSALIWSLRQLNIETFQTTFCQAMSRADFARPTGTLKTRHDASGLDVLESTFLDQADISFRGTP